MTPSFAATVVDFGQKKHREDDGQHQVENPWL
jgi:hypothetical protein